MRLLIVTDLIVLTLAVLSLLKARTQENNKLAIAFSLVAQVLTVLILMQVVL